MRATLRPTIQADWPELALKAKSAPGQLGWMAQVGLGELSLGRFGELAAGLMAFGLKTFGSGPGLKRADPPRPQTQFQ